MNYNEPYFYAFQNKGILWLQSFESSALDHYFFIYKQLGDGLYYPIFIILITVLYDFLFGVQLALMLMFHVMTNLTFKFWVRGGRPYWTNESVKALECHTKSWGFPSGHVQAPMAVGLYMLLYMARFRWRVQKKVLQIVLWILFLFILINIGISRLYKGVHFFHDVLCGYLFGIGMSLFTMFVLMPFIVRPLARLLMHTRAKLGFSIVLSACGIATVFAIVFFVTTTLVPERILGFPEEFWNEMSVRKCKEPIDAFKGYQRDFYKLLGATLGALYALCFCAKYAPFDTSQQKFLFKVLRLVLILMLSSPVVGCYFLSKRVFERYLKSFVALMAQDLILGIIWAFYVLGVVLPVVHRVGLLPLNRDMWLKACSKDGETLEEEPQEREPLAPKQQRTIRGEEFRNAEA